MKFLKSNVKKITTLLILLFSTVLFFQNCADDIDFNQYTLTSINTTPGPGPVENLDKVVGVIDGIQKNLSTGATEINGWACIGGYLNPIDVHLYLGGPVGVGTFVSLHHSNLPSESVVNTTCGGGGNNYRFTILIVQALYINYAGKTIFIHGISPPAIGGQNLTLSGSGMFVIPSGPL